MSGEPQISFPRRNGGSQERQELVSDPPGKKKLPVIAAHLFLSNKDP